LATDHDRRQLKNPRPLPAVGFCLKLASSSTITCGGAANDDDYQQIELSNDSVHFTGI
jgi:hypothetical protein